MLTGLVAVARGGLVAAFGSAIHAQTDVTLRTGAHLWKHRYESRATGRPVKVRTTDPWQQVAADVALSGSAWGAALLAVDSISSSAKAAL